MYSNVVYEALVLPIIKCIGFLKRYGAQLNLRKFKLSMQYKKSNQTRALTIVQ